MFRNTKLFFTMLLAMGSSLTYAQSYQDYQSDNCCTEWWDNISVRGEVLVWKTSEDNSYWGATTKTFPQDVGGAVGSVFQQKRKDFDFDYQAGFRVGLGYELPCSEWNVDLNWTHFHPSKKASATGSVTNIQDNTLIFTTFSPAQTAGNGFVSMDAKLKIGFDDVWLTTSRKFNCSCVEFEPFVGLDYLVIEQKVTLHGTNGFGVVTNPNPPPTRFFETVIDSEDIRLKTHFSGPGLVLGLKNRVDLGCGFSFLSRISGGAAYGRVNSTAKAAVLITGFPSSIPENDSYHKDIVVPQLNLDVGLDWNTCFWGFLTDFYVKWEYNRYYRQNYLYYPGGANISQGLQSQGQNTAPDGDLSFYGLTAGLNIVF